MGLIEYNIPTQKEIMLSTVCLVLTIIGLDFVAMIMLIEVSRVCVNTV